MTADVFKTAIAFFVAVVVQATIVSSVSVVGGKADLVLVTLAAVALLRGSIFGRSPGSMPASSSTQRTSTRSASSSLLLCLAGYWIGRYGETTGRNRAHAPLVSIAVVTVLYAFGALALHAMLEESVSVQAALRALPAAILLNLAADGPGLRSRQRLFAPPGARLPIKDVEFG